MPSPAVEPLETRVFFSFTGFTTADAFHLDRLIRDVGEAESNFGAVVAPLGDIDADGFADFAVAAPGTRGEEGRWTSGPGSVTVYSGRTASVIDTLSDGAPGFGAAIVSLGDVNGDGTPDFAIGSPSADPTADASIDFFGRVGVYSGASLEVIWSRQGVARLDELGWALAAAGDVDADGVMDLAIGAPGAGGDFSGPGAGAVHIVSGVDGASIASHIGEAAGDRFGHALDAGIDVPTDADSNEGDGFLDLLVGAPRSGAGGKNAGRAYVISGFDASYLHTFTGNAGDELGSAVSILGYGALNQGVLTRFAVGLPGNAAGMGRVHLYSIFGTLELAQNGTEIGSRFGAEIRRLDLSENPFRAPFFTIAAPNATTAARLHVYSGNPTELFPVQSAYVERASSVAVLGDVDADGIWDVIAGFAEPVEGSGPGAARLVPVPLLAVANWETRVVAASDNGQYFALGNRANFSDQYAHGGLQGYLVVNGQVVPMTSIDGLAPDSRFQGVNDAGLFIGATGQPEDFAYIPFENWFFLYQGSVVPLSTAATHFQGTPPVNMQLVRLSNTGDALFIGTSEAGVQRGYLFRAGVMTELPAASALDINDRGEMLLFSLEGAPVLLRADGSITPVTGLQAARKLGDDGVVYGTVQMDTAIHLATWRDGEITVLSEDIAPPEGAVARGWSIVDVDDAGRLIGRYEWEFPSPGQPPSVFPGINILYTPGEGIRQLQAIVTNSESVTEFFFSSAQLLDRGGFILEGSPFFPAGANPSDAGTVLTSAQAGPSGLYVSSINQAGEVVILRRDGIRAVRSILDVSVLLGSVDSVVTYTDPRDGNGYAMVRTALNRLIWFREQNDGSFGEGVEINIPGAEPIDGPLSTFTSTDGRVHIAGVTESGRVVIYYQTNLFAPDSTQNWSFDNLSLDHLEANQRPVPDFDQNTELVPYVTPWGGMNLAGLNSDGEIEVVWWAPGQIYWDHDALSEQAGTPALTGRLVSFVGSWGGLHLGGIGAQDGHLYSTWWAPGRAHWSFNDLTDEYAGPLLRPESLTAYVTGWNGLNIAGIDAKTGQAAVYWWTPTTGGWITETLNLGENPPALVGRLESAVRGNNLNIFGVTEDGETIRLFWYPSQASAWLIETTSGSVA